MGVIIAGVWGIGIYDLGLMIFKETIRFYSNCDIVRGRSGTQGTEDPVWV
jgi:hypothetical protein